MTGDEWDEVLTFIEDRWPDLTWGAKTCRAIFDDLADADAVDVWAAAYHLVNEGIDFLKPTQLIARSRIEEKERRAAERRGLPPRASTPPDREQYKAWLAAHGVTSVWGLVAQQHADRIRRGVVDVHDAEECALCVEFAGLPKEPTEEPDPPMAEMLAALRKEMA